MRTHRTGIRLESKVKTLPRIRKIAAYLKAKGKSVVFTNGCFDLLHYGHVRYLADAKAKGDCLIVGINSDASIRRIKGKSRPIVPEGDRARVIAALESVDYVVIFDEDTPLHLIEKIAPDVLVKGADWKVDEIVGKDVVESYGGLIRTIHFIKGRSTSALIAKIAKTT